MPAINLTRRGWMVIGIVVVILAVAGWGIRSGYFPEIGKFFAAEPAGYVPPCSWHGEPITGFSAQCCNSFEQVPVTYAPAPTPATVTVPPDPSPDGSIVLKLESLGDLYCTPNGARVGNPTPWISWTGPAIVTSNTPIEILRFNPNSGAFEVARTMTTQNYAPVDVLYPLYRPLALRIRLVSDHAVMSNIVELPIDCSKPWGFGYSQYCAVSGCTAVQRSVDCSSAECPMPSVEMVCPPGTTIPPRPSYTPTPLPTAVPTVTPPPSCVPLPPCVYEGTPRCALDPMPGVTYCPTPAPTGSYTPTPPPPSFTPTPRPTPSPTPTAYRGVMIGVGNLGTIPAAKVIPVGLTIGMGAKFSQPQNPYRVTGLKTVMRLVGGSGHITGYTNSTTFPDIIRNILSPDGQSIELALGVGAGNGGVVIGNTPFGSVNVEAKVGSVPLCIAVDRLATDIAAEGTGGNVFDANYIGGWESQVCMTVGVAKPGDADGNGKVDIFDYNIVVTNFGRTGTSIPGDLDGNGKVDIFDYNLVVSNFGK